MKVMIGKRTEKGSTITVIPSRRLGLPPVMVREVKKGKVRETVRGLVDAVKKAPGEPAG